MQQNAIMKTTESRNGGTWDKESARYEVKLSGVPDGAYTEEYLDGSRYFRTKRAAEKAVRDLYRGMRNDPENFEANMTAEIVRL